MVLMRQFFPKITDTKGFTLVELAIVMVIIGLLIGGILKGQELIAQSKVKGTIKMVESVRSSFLLFRDKYNATPGDMRMATAQLPNCSGTCVNGNGDMIIGAMIPDPWLAASQAGNAGLPQVETTMFWKHLALADFITGIDTSAPATEPEIGRTHPSVPLGGTLEAVTVEGTGTNDFGAGITLIYKTAPSQAPASSLVISPILAKQIDEKMDDGHPDRGQVSGDSGVSGCDNGGIYQNTEDTVCVMYFNIAPR